MSVFARCILGKCLEIFTSSITNNVRTRRQPVWDSRKFALCGSLPLLLCTEDFNTKNFYVLPTQCVCVFCVDFRTNSDYFPIQQRLTGFYNWDGECLLRGTDWIYIYIYIYICMYIHDSLYMKPSKAQWSLYAPPVYHSAILRSAQTLCLCVLCGSQNKQRLFPYTTLTGWFL